ncbi:hypothetical protein [Streptomyces sp. NPDC055692]|uniref:hypothetical protein n=1 Tax=Streptomyces sp. NPDC055692 TaxID=3155683 RepID=UPI0034306960
MPEHQNEDGLRADAGVGRGDARRCCDGEAISHFQQALSVPGADRSTFEAARIRLAFGERLRRSRGKGKAREPLAAAADTFIRLGATSWAERARKELPCVMR